MVRSTQLAWREVGGAPWWAFARAGVRREVMVVVSKCGAGQSGNSSERARDVLLVFVGHS